MVPSKVTVVSKLRIFGRSLVVMIILGLVVHRVWRRHVKRQVISVVKATKAKIMTYIRMKINTQREWDANRREGGQRSGHKASTC